ncbi:MAG: polyprenyl synthetase family protein [Cytophagales bacterium]|nr:polyprenyl synthetase family protein [Cytophagales bacterium]
MGLSLKEIQTLIKEEMKEFETRFQESLKAKGGRLINSITAHIVKRKGKQMRPMYVFLIANLCGGVKQETYRGAQLVELLHTATLLHDDVVDEANYRRGFFSVNALWKNKTAILVGDFLLSKGLLLSIDNDDFNLLKIVSNAVREMSEGELLQIEKARKLDITEDIYFEVIRQKTASLLASCCAVGAASSGASAEDIEKMRLFGEKVGLAFQMKDDLFDYGMDEVGKPLGIDIKERKMTLPLIYALNNASWMDKKRIKFLVKYQNENPEKVEEVIEFVKKSGGLEYTSEYMHKICNEALSILDDFGDSTYKDALIGLVNYTIQRKK